MKHPSLGIIGTKNSRLKGKKIVLAIAGSVACIKSFELCRELMRRGADVQIVMSDAALKMVSADLMEYASGNEVITSLGGKIEHVKFFGAKGEADLLLIAPATSNTISKIAMGIDDTPITAMAVTAIGSRKPFLIAPAMHYSMYNHPIVQANIEKLKAKGVIRFVQPMIAEDKAKFADVGIICLEIEKALSGQTLQGKKILVVSGKSYEPLDDVRVITNRATGKTGIEIAKELYRKGAEVCIIHNEIIGLPFREGKAEAYEEFFEKAVKELEKGYDMIICPAALGDFSVEKTKGKIKSSREIAIKLKPNRKLLKEARKRFPKLLIFAFKAEFFGGKRLEDLAKEFLNGNKFDFVAANDIGKNPLGSEKNELIIVSKKNKVGIAGSKEEIAEKIADFIADKI